MAKPFYHRCIHVTSVEQPAHPPVLLDREMAFNFKIKFAPLISLPKPGTAFIENVLKFAERIITYCQKANANNLAGRRIETNGREILRLTIPSPVMKS